MIKKIFILFIIVFFFVLFGCTDSEYESRSKDYDESSIITENISNMHVNCFAEDKFGYIWMGTSRGLNRYNGYEYHQYFNDPNDSLSINSNFIRTIFNDSQGQLWIGTVNGICKYNVVSDNFERIRLQTNNISPAQIIESKKGKVFANMVENLCEYLPEKNEFVTVLKFEQGVFANTCYIDKYDRLWLISPSYIKCYDLINFKLLKEIEVPLKNAKSCSSYLDENNQLWVTFDNNLYSIDLNIQDCNINFPIIKKIVIPSYSSISNIYLFNHKYLLIITKMDGLFRYSLKTGDIIHESDKNFPYEVPESRINSVFTDSNKNLWLAPNDHGFLIIHENRKQFNLYNYLIKLTKGKSVTAIAIDKDKNLWASTPDNYDLVIYNLIHQTSSEINLKNVINPEDLKDKINYIYIDSDNYVWFLINDIVFKCSYRDHQLKLIEKYTFPVIVTSIGQDNAGTIWVGGFSEYIYVLKANSKIFTKIKLYDKDYIYINDIILMKSGSLLVSSFNQSIKKISPDGSQITEFKKIQSLNKPVFVPSCVYKDSKNNIWLGTLGQGLYYYNTESEKVTIYDEDSFRRGINSITEDLNGHIWAGTNYGLIEIDPNTQNATTYYSYDGTGGNQFNKHAVCSLADSILFFGGTHGLTIFNPAHIRKNNKIPLYFENLSVNNNIQTPHNNTTIGENLIFKPTVKLKSYHNNVEITYAALDYDKYRHLRYFYKMEGYDKDWVDAKYSRQAIYSNLPSGDYTFKVKVINNDKNIIVAENSINIIKEQIFWLRGYMITVYIIIITAVIIFINYLFLKIREDKTKIIITENEMQHEAYINKMNMKFFTNMSHEFRTPLTMISGPIKMLTGSHISLDEKKELLQILNRSVKRMLKLLDQIMDFNKLEEDTLKLEKEKYDIIKVINDTIQIFEINAKERGILLLTSGLNNSIIISFDKDKLEKILENILSNALKFTPNKGIIRLSVEILSKEEVRRSYQVNNEATYTHYIEITIENTGSHIPEDKLYDIFKRYYQIEDPVLKTHNLGNGIGLYYTKQLVRLQHGYVKAENKNDESVVFSFVIPADQGIGSSLQEINTPNQSKVLEDKPYKTIDEGKKSRQGIYYKNTILIVDDDIDIAQYLNTLLSQYYNVINCFDVESAYEVINRKAPDIIISDVRMPGTDGYQFCEMIKKDLIYSHIPVILLTAKSLLEEQIYGLNLGANAYVTKPFDPNYLLAVIKSEFMNRDNMRNLISNIDKRTTLEIEEEGILSVQDKIFLKNFYDLMEKELANVELDISQMSQDLGMGRSKFFYKVKGLTGTTPNNFFKNYRLNRAAEYLKEKQYNISEIADITGFRTLSHFSASFKKRFGVSPTDYQQ